MEDVGLVVFENRMLRRKLGNLCSQDNVISVIKIKDKMGKIGSMHKPTACDHKISVLRP